MHELGTQSNFNIKKPAVAGIPAKRRGWKLLRFTKNLWVTVATTNFSQIKTIGDFSDWNKFGISSLNFKLEVLMVSDPLVGVIKSF